MKSRSINEDSVPMPSDFYEKHLKTFPVETPGGLYEEMPYLACFPELARAFQKLTGYVPHLCGEDQKEQFAIAFPIPEKNSEERHYLGLSRNLTSMSLIPEQDVFGLARSVADMLAETTSLQMALRKREAELASNIQLTFHLHKDYGLAERLCHILKTGAESVGCQASALYLLDHETSHLKLRSAWGLPEERLAERPRPLNGALADLEAMLGHAVILNDDFLLERWNVPESFETSVCIPVSSTTTVHGTLWFFSNEKKTFSDTQLGFMEIVSGRIAVELERCTLLREGHDSVILKRQLTDAEHVIQDTFPKAEISNDDWQFAGGFSHPRPLAATSYDWHKLPPGYTLASVISTSERNPNVEAQIRCAIFQAEMGYLAKYLKKPKRILEEIQDMVFAEHAKKNSLSMMIYLVDHQKKVVRLAGSEHFVQFYIKPTTVKLLEGNNDSGGLELSNMRKTRLSSGESLVTIHLGHNALMKEKIVKSVLTHPDFQDQKSLCFRGNAQQIAEFMTERFQEKLSGENITVLVVKNP